MLLRLAQLLLTLPLLLLTYSALAQPTPPADANDQAATNARTETNTDGSQAEVPEAPHYYRWVDAKGQTHFADRPPEDSKQSEAKKEALTPAPETGSGDDLKHVYQRANNIMSPPPKPQPANGSWKQLPKAPASDAPQ